MRRMVLPARVDGEKGVVQLTGGERWRVDVRLFWVGEAKGAILGLGLSFVRGVIGGRGFGVFGAHQDFKVGRI